MATIETVKVQLVGVDKGEAYRIVSITDFLKNEKKYKKFVPKKTAGK